MILLNGFMEVPLFEDYSISSLTMKDVFSSSLIYTLAAHLIITKGYKRTNDE